jgi:hypothetical protein
MIYKNGSDLFHGLIEFINNSTSLSIFAPYIKLETLKRLIDEKIKGGSCFRKVGT